MNKEHQDWFNLIKTAAQEMGQLMQETVDAAVETAELMMQIPIVMAEQVEEAIATEIEHVLDQLAEWFQPPPPIHLSIWSQVEWQSSGVEPWIQTVDPEEGHQNACIGCRHYHGCIYNDNLLVCGMHPYGWEGDRCPDWEGH